MSSNPKNVLRNIEYILASGSGVLDFAIEGEDDPFTVIVNDVHN